MQGGVCRRRAVSAIGIDHSEFQPSRLDVDLSHGAFSGRDNDLIVAGIEGPDDVETAQGDS